MRDDLFSFVNKILNRFFSYFSIFFILLSFYIFFGNLFFLNKQISKFYNFFPKVNFGLDISGGTQLKVAPNFDKFYNKLLEDFLLELPDLSWNNDFLVKKAFIEDRKINIEFENKEDLLKFKKERKIYDKIQCNFDEKSLKSFCYIRDKALLQKEEIEKISSIIKNRIDGMQVKEISVIRDGEDKISILIPKGLDLEKIKNIIFRMARLSFHEVPDTSELKVLNKLKESGTLKEFTFKNSDKKIPLKAKATIEGDKIQEARAFKDEGGRNAIFFRLNSKGRDQFAVVTKKNVNKPLAIVLDDEIVSMPLIKEQIASGAGSISGTFEEEEARNLAIILKSGSISTDIQIIEEKNINFSISDNFKKGIEKAIIFTFLSVFVFMVLRYKKLGIIAFFTLFLNFVFTIAISAIFGFTITIPSLAGIILMLGMSIDINILVYERIREVGEKKKLSYAVVKNSFDIVQKTIADSNLTTILAVVSLLSFGDAFLKGFSIILITGIVSSVFSCFYLSKKIILKIVR